MSLDQAIMGESILLNSPFFSLHHKEMRTAQSLVMQA